MTKLEELEQRIFDSDISIEDFNTKEIVGVAVEFKKKKTIILNRQKIKNKTHERTILAHEFFHFKTGTLYKLDECPIVKAKKEYKCNKYMIQELVPVIEFKRLLALNYDKWEIASFFDVEEWVVDLAFEIYKKLEMI